MCVVVGRPWHAWRPCFRELFTDCEAPIFASIEEEFKVVVLAWTWSIGYKQCVRRLLTDQHIGVSEISFVVCGSLQADVASLGMNSLILGSFLTCLSC